MTHLRLIGGVLFRAVERWLPRHTLLRGLVFGLLCFAIASPGIRPPQLLTFGLFSPFFLGYGFRTQRCPATDCRASRSTT